MCVLKGAQTGAPFFMHRFVDVGWGCCFSAQSRESLVGLLLIECPAPLRPARSQRNPASMPIGRAIPGADALRFGLALMGQVRLSLLSSVLRLMVDANSAPVKAQRTCIKETWAAGATGRYSRRLYVTPAFVDWRARFKPKKSRDTLAAYFNISGNYRFRR
jgi:hypothetical protein